MLLTREQLVLQQQERTVLEVLLPESGDSVNVRALMLAEAREYNKMCKDQGLDDLGCAALLCAWCIVDPNGIQMFNPKAEADIKVISEHFVAANVIRIYTVCDRLISSGKDEVTKHLKNYLKTDENSESGNSESAASSESATPTNSNDS